MSMIKLFRTNFAHHAVVDVVCGRSIKFRHPRLTILALIQTDITFAQMKVSREKTLWHLIHLNTNKQTNKPQITLMSLLGEFPSFRIIARRQLSCDNNMKMRSNSQKSLIGFVNNIPGVSEQVFTD